MTPLVNGLSLAEVKRRQTESGFNELPIRDQKTFLKSVYEVLTEPMFGLLILASLIYLMIGSLEDSLILMGFIVISIGITLFQQRKSQKAIEALKDLSSPRALVIREGKMIEHRNLKGPSAIKSKISLHIHLSTDATPYATFISSIHGVSDVETDSHQFHLGLDTEIISKSELLKKLVDAHLPVEEFHERKINLQDEYIKTVSNLDNKI